jgi:hypothetical protein
LASDNYLLVFFSLSALEYDKYYTKARLRRAQMYEASEKLDEALNGERKKFNLVAILI